MKSLYAQYLEEKFGIIVIENEHGFITYQINGEVCHSFDMFIRPESRNRTEAQKLFGQVEEIARAEGCKAITGSVTPKSNEPGRTLMIFLKHGFEIMGCDANAILIKKDL